MICQVNNSFRSFIKNNPKNIDLQNELMQADIYEITDIIHRARNDGFEFVWTNNPLVVDCFDANKIQVFLTDEKYCYLDQHPNFDYLTYKYNLSNFWTNFGNKWVSEQSPIYINIEKGYISENKFCKSTADKEDKWTESLNNGFIWYHNSDGDGWQVICKQTIGIKWFGLLNKLKTTELKKYDLRLTIKKGWITKDLDGKIFWYKNKPRYDNKYEQWFSNNSMDYLCLNNSNIYLGLNFPGGKDSWIRILHDFIMDISL
jgi:hypothetical protein